VKLVAAVRSACLGLALLAFALPGVARAAELRAGIHDDFGRIVVEWPHGVRYTARIEGTRLIVDFAEPLDADPAELVPRLPTILRAARLEDNRRRVVFDLRGNYQLASQTFGNSVVLDLSRANAPAQAAPAAGDTPLIPVRVGIHDAYARVVFDWPRSVGYTVTQAGDRAIVAFAAPGRIDLPNLRANLPDGAKDAREDSRAPLTVSLPSKALPKHFRAGTGGRAIAVDIVTGPDAAPAAAKPADAKAAPAAAAKPEAKPQAKPAADAKAASAPAPLVAPDGGKPQGQVASLSFSWDQPTGAAVFRRAGYIWIVFDRPHSIDVPLMRRLGKGVVDDIEQVPNGRATVVRVLAPPQYNPSLRREGLLWIVDLMPQPLRPLRSIEVEPQMKAPGGPRLFLPIAEGGAPVQVVDPEIGDTMWVVPVIPLGYGVSPERSYVDAVLPVTAQGVVVLPRADDVEVASNRTGIEVSRKTGGLRLSGQASEAAAVAGVVEATPVSKAFDFKTWIAGGEETFVADKRRLMEGIIAASDPARNAARMNLAQFFLAHGYGAEALGVLRAIASDDPKQVEQPGFLAVRGAAGYLMHRPDEALADLSAEVLKASSEAQFWRALAALQTGATTNDKPALADAVLRVRAAAPVLKDYPPHLRARLALDGATALADAGDDVGVRNFLDLAKRDDPSIQEIAEIAYLTGRMHAAAGALDSAIADYERAEATGVRPFRARAAFARIVMMHKMGKLSDAAAIDGLDRLRFAWRGDDFEYALLRKLAELDLGAKRYGDGLRVLKQMAGYFGQSPNLKDVTELMRTTFRELYLNGRADDIPPVRAIALFDEFRELAPPGAEGDEMIRKLADRLVSVDLLDQAAALLDHQVQTRLSGAEKSRVGARLAVVQLLNRQPALALAALKTSEAPGLPVEITKQRELLRARALADLGQADEALKILNSDNGDDANLLKAEIEWRRQNWTGASEALSRTVRAPDPGTQMSMAMRQRVLQWVTALRLSDQRREIAQLRRDYLPFMNATPEFDAFNLLTNRTSPGLIDMASVEEQIKQAENFRSFLGEYKTRMKEGGLSGIN
jgi:hypothetical protein